MAGTAQPRASLSRTLPRACAAACNNMGVLSLLLSDPTALPYLLQVKVRGSVTERSRGDAALPRVATRR